MMKNYTYKKRNDDDKVVDKHEIVFEEDEIKK